MKWIKHVGNEMPVSGNTQVFIKTRSKNISHLSNEASFYDWNNDAHPGYILEYALAEEEQKPQEKTLRDEFAMAALTGMLADSEYAGNVDDYAHYAYKCADAMIKARSK
ncbi:hypothetical protein ACO0K2_17985 [Undibacterium sp. MH2W]|uniref:hypothetical protein n=1 Tax=Undibacterium sp. MH2W TaxID=3413044 RepID=UPI003BF3D973